MRNAFVLCASALLSLSACGGGQPRIFRIALDKGPSRNVNSASCYKSNQVPVTTEQYTNLVSEAQWVVWDGESSTQYLDVGHFQLGIADAPRVDFADLVKSTEPNKTFAAQHQRVTNITNASSRTSWVVTFTFDQMGSLATGKVDVRSEYECSGSACPTGQAMPFTSCGAVMPFVGRRMDLSQITDYRSVGQTP